MPNTNQQNNVSENTNDLFPKPIIKDGVTYSLIGKESITRVYLLDGAEERDDSYYDINLVATATNGDVQWTTLMYHTGIQSPEYIKTIITGLVLEGSYLKITIGSSSRMIDIKTGEIQEE